MSVTVSFSPVGRGDQAMRWARALDRAKSAGIQVVSLDQERFVVTSATVPGIAYIATPTTCGCIAAQRGDTVCLHRAAVKNIIGDRPEPRPPAHLAYDPIAEQLKWAENDLQRAYKDMERYTARIERGEVLGDREFLAFEFSQQREQEASEHIAELKGKNVTVAA
jgi:hypothetical protein